jgi:hypothetical protein
MAFRDNIFYNADGFVGPPDPQGIHRGTRNIVAANPTKFKTPFRPPAKFPTMKVDGIYGETTANWIGAVQNHLHNIGRPVLRDGVVDRVRSGLQLSPNGFVWTMVMLNVAMGQVTGDELWDEWWKEPSVPAMLRDKVRNPATFL